MSRLWEQIRSYNSGTSIHGDDHDDDDNNDNDDDAARQDGGGVGPDPGHSPLRLPPLLLHDPAQPGH